MDDPSLAVGAGLVPGQLAMGLSTRTSADARRISMSAAKTRVVEPAGIFSVVLAFEVKNVGVSGR